MQRITLNVIHAVRAHRRFLVSDYMLRNQKDFDWMKLNEEYFHSLPDTGELKKNRAGFKIIHGIPEYDLNRYDEMEDEELSKQTQWIYYG